MIGFVKRLMVTFVIASIGILVGVSIAPAPGEDTRAKVSAVMEERMEDLRQTFGRGQQAVESAFASFASFASFRETARTGMDKDGGD